MAILCRAAKNSLRGAQCILKNNPESQSRSLDWRLRGAGAERNIFGSTSLVSHKRMHLVRRKKSELARCGSLLVSANRSWGGGVACWGSEKWSGSA